MLEREYQAQLIKRIRERFPGCFIIKNDSSYQQGVPDLLVLYNDRWAMLEVKPQADFRSTPSQRYYVKDLNRMSFASFIHPGNEEEVLNDLQYTFAFTRKTRVSKRKQERLD